MLFDHNTAQMQQTQITNTTMATVNIVPLAYTKCKLPMSLFETNFPKMLPKFAFAFGQYMQLITIHWTDLTTL